MSTAYTFQGRKTTWYRSYCAIHNIHTVLAKTKALPSTIIINAIFVLIKQTFKYINIVCLIIIIVFTKPNKNYSAYKNVNGKCIQYLKIGWTKVKHPLLKSENS